MKIKTTPLSGLLIIEPTVWHDDRGYFFEGHHTTRFEAHDLPVFAQDNFSRSKQDVLRGLHYQLPHSQGKLVGVTRGVIWDVAVDIRLSSPTFGQWFAITLSDENHLQFYVPPGFAHGFCVLSPEADFYYKCTDHYHVEHEHGLLWNDPEINIPWPVKKPILSNKDAQYQPLRMIPHEHLFT